MQKKLKRVEIDLLGLVEDKEVHEFIVDDDIEFFCRVPELTNIELKRHLRFVHTKPGKQTRFDIKMLVGHASFVILEVTIVAHKGMKDIKSELEMRALLLDPVSSVQFVPILEIDEKDVDIEHRASMGAPDPEHLFYLESRGLNKHEAVSAIAEAFLS